MTILVTGAAGFIGMHVVERLLARGENVVGLDNLNNYYEVSLKESRLARIASHPNFTFQKLDVADRPAMEALFASTPIDRVVHLAAQAGVRHSLTAPFDYVSANLQGFLTILEGCRQRQVKHLVYASSSSVYGLNSQLPFSVHGGADHPVSLYAATKKANEVMAHSYCHLFGFPATGLRFFTVYGPWGRPDMALFHFTKRILAGETIELYNYGKMRRDFTYVDDIVDGIIAVLDRPAQSDPKWKESDPSTSSAKHRVLNIGGADPVELSRFVAAIEKSTGCKAKIELKPMQPGDVEATAADVSDLEQGYGVRPQVNIETGVEKFVQWYRKYYGV